jgi:transcriptional regulator with XRE-family HTH domain
MDMDKPIRWSYLRRAATNAEMNWRQLEKRSGINNSDLSAYYNLHRMPSVSRFIVLSKALDIPLHIMILSNPLVQREIKS